MAHIAAPSLLYLALCLTDDIDEGSKWNAGQNCNEAGTNMQEAESCGSSTNLNLSTYFPSTLSDLSGTAGTPNPGDLDWE